MEQLIPNMMSEKPSKQVPQLPFKFQGGFAFSTRTIGIILSVQGILQMFAQLVIFPCVSKRLGNLRTFWVTIGSYPLLYLIAPYLVLLPDHFRIPGILFILTWKVIAQSLSYPSLNIMLANAAPSKKVLGTLNGAAASSASVCRGFGPTVSGLIQTAGERAGYSGVAWWACGVVALIGWMPGYFMKEERRRQDLEWLDDDREDEEVGLREALSGPDSDAGSVITLAPEDTVEEAVQSKR